VRYRKRAAGERLPASLLDKTMYGWNFINQAALEISRWLVVADTGSVAHFANGGLIPPAGQARCRT